MSVSCYYCSHNTVFFCLQSGLLNDDGLGHEMGQTGTYFSLTWSLCVCIFDDVEVYFHSRVSNKSSPSSLLPTLMARDLTLPALGACTTISIFMADSTTNGAPFSTVSPTFTLTSITVPGIGAPTWSLFPFSAFG